MTDRNLQLDGLRGLAALSVAIGHCATNIGGMQAYLLSLGDLGSSSARDLGFRAIHIVFNADAAVPVFFVLSGYVLSLSLSQRDMLAWQTAYAYFVRRVFRLLPVSLVAAIITGPIINVGWSLALKAGFLLDYTMNGVIWSLQVEVIGSVVIFFTAMATFIWRKLMFPIFLALCAFSFFKQHYLVLLLPCFLLGAMIGQVPRSVFRGPIAGIALIVMLCGDYVAGHGFGGHIAHSIGAFFVVGYVATRGPSWLLRPSIQFLGHVSYPFYLLHLAGIVLVTQWLAMFGIQLPPGSFRSFAFLSASSIVVALVLSWIVHVLVEKPYITVGSEWARRATSRLNAR